MAEEREGEGEGPTRLLEELLLERLVSSECVRDTVT